VRNIVFIVFSFLWFFFLAPCSLAQEQLPFEISPHIIDEKAKAKDILEYDIKIKNNTERKIELYAIVSDITDEDGSKDFDFSGMDKTASLAKWISIKRAQIEVKAGEEIVLPLKIDVNLAAKPGKYYSSISFAPGGNPNEAKENSLKATAQKLMINVDVQDQVVEKAQINHFKTIKNTFFSSPVVFEVDLKNIGNTNVVVDGFIHIYNKRGEEVGTVDITEQSKAIKPEESSVFSFDWDSGDLSGRYKAKLNLGYGVRDRAEMQDIIYFMILPWPKLAVLAAILVVLITILTIIIFKKTYKYSGHEESDVSVERVHPHGVLDLKNRE